MIHLNRRSLLGHSFFGAGATLLSRSACAADDIATGEAIGNPYAKDGVEQWIIDDSSAVADTESGKVVGYIRSGIRIFMGIPYAEVLSPEGRWMRGTKVRPWTGKRSSRATGPVSPPDHDMGGDGYTPGHDEFQLNNADYQAYRAGEDCLRVNVWTPGTDNKKRQVLFYCHGGGFNNGSPMMALRFEGHNLARYGDVVIVSVCHRLNALGFLNLTTYGERYADSANLGVLDIVDALKWVKVNIANFGGDPDKVMIFGHSGGGAKVATLLSMPEAKGLFNRAVIQSPGPLPFSTPEQSASLSASFLKLVSVSSNNLDALHKIPAAQLCHASGPISSAFGEARDHYSEWGPATPRGPVGWRPVVDGRTVLYDPLHPTVPSDVPLMIGTTLHETYGALDHPEYAQMPEAQAQEIVRGFYGPLGNDMYNTYRDMFPKAAPYELSAIARATGHFRTYCVKIAQRRAAFHAAPAYNYWIHWRAANIFEGRAMSHHELEMPLIFLNSDAFPNVTGGTANARALSLKLADAWLAFARTGNPNTKALPNWNQVTPDGMTTMVFDNTCRIDHGSDLAAIDMFWKDRFSNA